MRGIISATATILVLFFAISSFSDDVKPGQFGVFYNCGFPAEDAKLDGQFNEPFWSAVPWDKVTHEMGWGTLPDDDADGSCEFACVADAEFLYVAIKVYDDDKVVGEDMGDAMYEDDCMEVYIDGGNEKAGAYDLNDSQIMIARDNVDNPDCPDDPLLAGNHWKGDNFLKGADTGTKASVIDTNYGWAVEAAIPLDTFEIQLADGVIIGFNVQLNDDDDGGSRDHKLSWSEVERAGVEDSHLNPGVFGELRFVEASLAVSSDGKLTATWAWVKMN